jgi:hypothetical protein
MLKHDWRYESMFLQLQRKREIDAPYLFIYHHRAYWKDLLAQCPHTVREHLNLLAFYVSENYGQEYMAADSLFARRKVSAEFIKYLFQPGDILISQSMDQYRGLVAISWPQEDTAIPARGSHGTEIPLRDYSHRQSYMEQPDFEVDSEVDSDNGTREDNMRSSVEAIKHKEQDFVRQHFRHIHPGTTLKVKDKKKTGSAKASDKEFEIKIWQWKFDGDFKRVEGNIVLRLSQSSVNDPTRAKEWNMHDLNVYPLRFASQTLAQTLHRRGIMFWQCRKRCLVSYHESDAQAQDEVGRFLSHGIIFERVDANLRQV